jgi:DNA gyrase/topoisomerase IV subunit B
MDPRAPIQALSSIQAIRRRPSVYLGPRDGVPLANLALREAFCLSRDAASRGCCREIMLTLRAGGEALIHDDGPGLPLDRDAEGVTWAERAFTVLRACAEAKPKELARTTCELGLVVLNAVCARLDIELHQGGEHWTQTYLAGVALAPLRRVGATKARGLRLHIQLDPTVLPELEFDLEELTAWLSQAKEGARFVVNDERTGAQRVI